MAASLLLGLEGMQKAQLRGDAVDAGELTRLAGQLRPAVPGGDAPAGADHPELHPGLLRQRPALGRYGRGRDDEGGLQPKQRHRYSRRHQQLQGRARHPILLAILDEVAFWSEEDSARPPDEPYAAIESGLSSLETAGSRIVGISAPYRKTGLLFRKFEELRFMTPSNPRICALDSTKTPN